MYEHPHEHLLAELRRFDLILIAYLSSLRPATDAAKAEHEEVKVSLVASLGDGDASAWGRLDDVEAALRRQIESVRHDVRASLARGKRLPVVELCRALELDAHSLGILVLTCAPHFDRKYARVFSYLQGSRTATAPRVELALDLFARDSAQRFELRRTFEPASPLLRSGHVRLGGSDDVPLLDRELHASARLARHLIGHDTPDPLVAAMTPTEPLVDPTRGQQEALARFAHVWRSEQCPGALAVIVTDDAEGIITGARTLAQERGVPLVAVDLAKPAALRVMVDTRVGEAFREATLRGALLCVAGYPQLQEGEREHAAREIAANLETFTGPCILVGDLATRLRHELRRRPLIELSPTPPDTDERSALWKDQLGRLEHAATDVSELAWRYRLGAAEIRDAVRLAEADVHSHEGKWSDLLPPALVQACRSRSRRDLDALAQSIRPRGEWSDLILPETSLQQLRELVRHLKYHDLVFGTWGLKTKVLHGDGVTALFAGPPGTGKTMASALIACELGRELFRIDLAGVVSKYIGETEKNLEKVFAAAHRSNAILFFDEADALFGKRTEVKDAHDRYANVETSYLLQKIESFDGVVILATNFRKNVDEAFLRRMAVVVDFPMPDAAERKRLWKGLFPASMPHAPDIDTDFLAKQFEISGGHIKNAIQSAAMAAAEEQPPVVRFAHLLTAVQKELRKLGRVSDAADFGRYRALLDHATAEPRARPR
jgi:AAA+ superfamily predicted ATPase